MKPAIDVRQLTDEQLIRAMEKEEIYSPYVLGSEYLRRKRVQKKKITYPADVLSVVHSYRNRRKEHFIVITLNGAHHVIKANVITKGIVNNVLAHPREIFRISIQQNAVAIILVHNHPSGSIEPSDADRMITHRTYESGEILGISVLDHLIVTKDSYYSFLEAGDMK